MSAYAKYANDAQEQFFAGLSQLSAAQEQILNAVKEGRPVTQELPTPAEVITNAYAFTGRLLDFQKEAALRWVNTVGEVAATAKPAI
jgi:CHASE2 domain-containing sensor protein